MPVVVHVLMLEKRLNCENIAYDHDVLFLGTQARDVDSAGSWPSQLLQFSTEI